MDKVIWQQVLSELKRLSDVAQQEEQEELERIRSMAAIPLDHEAAYVQECMNELLSHNPWVAWQAAKDGRIIGRWIQHG